VRRGSDQRTETRNVEVIPHQFEVSRLTLDPQTSKLLDPAHQRPEVARLNAIFAGHAGPPRWQGPFKTAGARAPVITTNFGDRRSYNGGPVASYHAAPTSPSAGHSRHAPAPGTVVLAEALQVRGNAVVLDHGAGVYTL